MVSKPSGLISPDIAAPKVFLKSLVSTDTISELGHGRNGFGKGLFGLGLGFG